MRNAPGISAVLCMIALSGVQCTQKSVELVIAPCFPTSISTNVSTTGFSQSLSYNYNSTNLVISTATANTLAGQTVTVNTTYAYDTDGNIVSASISGDGSNTVNNYTYDISHKLTQETQQVDGVLKVKIVYHYNATQQFIGAENTSFAGSASTTTTSAYTYNTPVSRNPVMVTSSSGDTWTYTYDTKPNPLKVLFVSIQPDNNVTRMTMTSGGSAKTTTYTYQYDSNGFPVARTGSDGETKAYNYFCK